MNELLKLDENGNQAVSARELHAALEVGRDFSTWIKDRIEKYGFEDGRDYQICQSPNLGIGDSGHTGGKPSVNYLLTISTAKEIAMVENNEQGRQIRQYLIKVEEAWNEPAMVIARALQLADKRIKALEFKTETDRPKVEFYDQVAGSNDAIQMRDVAAVLNIAGWGRNNIFALLRQLKILDGRNIPYRSYQDKGYFRVVEQEFTDAEGETHINLKTLAYQTGVDYIRKLIQRQTQDKCITAGPSGKAPPPPKVVEVGEPCF